MSAPPPLSRLPMLAAASVGVQVGLATVGSRFALETTDPASLAVLRYSLAFLCLIPFLKRGPERFGLADVVAMSALGIIQFGLLILLFNTALLTLPAARVAILFSVFPMLTLLLAAMLGREPLTGAKFAGAVLTAAGVALALGGGQKGQLDLSIGLAEVAALSAALCGAVASVFYRPYVVRYGAVTVGAIAMLSSVIALGAGLVAMGRPLDVARLTPAAAGTVAFVGLSSGLGYLALLWAFSKSTPTRVTIFQPLAPVTAAALGWAVLGETITPLFAVGVAVLGMGIILAHR